jgi:hypothetical protein
MYLEFVGNNGKNTPDYKIMFSLLIGVSDVDRTSLYI